MATLADLPLGAYISTSKTQRDKKFRLVSKSWNNQGTYVPIILANFSTNEGGYNYSTELNSYDPHIENDPTYSQNYYANSTYHQYLNAAYLNDFYGANSSKLKAKLTTLYVVMGDTTSSSLNIKSALCTLPSYREATGFSLPDRYQSNSQWHLLSTDGSNSVFELSLADIGHEVATRSLYVFPAVPAPYDYHFSPIAAQYGVNTTAYYDSEGAVVIQNGKQVNYPSSISYPMFSPSANIQVENVGTNEWIFIFNSPPTKPITAIIPSTIHTKIPFDSEVTASTDPDGDQLVYELQRSRNNGSTWVALYTSTTPDTDLTRTFTSTIGDTNPITDRWRAKDIVNTLYSDWAYTATVTPTAYTPPTISPMSIDHGLIQNPPTFTFNYTGIGTLKLTISDIRTGFKYINNEDLPNSSGQYIFTMSKNDFAITHNQVQESYMVKITDSTNAYVEITNTYTKDFAVLEAVSIGKLTRPNFIPKCKLVFSWGEKDNMEGLPTQSTTLAGTLQLWICNNGTAFKTDAQGNIIEDQRAWEPYVESGVLKQHVFTNTSYDAQNGQYSVAVMYKITPNPFKNPYISDIRIKLSQENGEDKWGKVFVDTDIVQLWASCWAPEINQFTIAGQSLTVNSNGFKSTNGLTWDSINIDVPDSSGIDIASMCWSTELSKYVAVTNNTLSIYTSPNGSNWALAYSTSNPEKGLNSVCWSKEVGKFVAVGRSSDMNVIYNSPDGVNWAESSSPVVAKSSLHSVCWAKELGKYVAVGFKEVAGIKYGTIYTSSNGDDWSTGYTTPEEMILKSVCWSAGKNMLIAVGYSSNAGLIASYKSSAGVTWVKSNISIERSPLCHAVCWSPEKSLFAAVGGEWVGDGYHATVYTTTDGDIWTKIFTGIEVGLDLHSISWASSKDIFIAAGHGVDSIYVTPANPQGYFSIIYNSKSNAV